MPNDVGSRLAVQGKGVVMNGAERPGRYSGLNFLVLCAAVIAVLGGLATASPAAYADTIRGTGFGQIAGGPLGRAGFSDSFGMAVDDAPEYGLNDSLAARQSGATGVTYTRVSGLWYAAPAPQPWYSQVNHVNHPGVLSFWLGTSAVRMDAPVVANAAGVVAASATVDPVTGDSHLAEVAGRSNLNWVNISDVDGYAASVLDGCAAGSCVVNTGNEFFSCDSSGNKCVLYPDYQTRWQKLASAVQPYLGKIAAFYILDEPQWRGATPAAIQASAQLIKSTFPGKKVMMIKAGPEVTSSPLIPPAVDWVGFDWYCQPFSVIQQKLTTLESVTASSKQGLFLVPEDAPLAQCAGASGHAADADIAALQRQYFGLAEQNPRVIGLMDFGFWTSPGWDCPEGGTACLFRSKIYRTLIRL